MKLMKQTLATLLLLGLAVQALAQSDQGGIIITGDPVQQGGDLHQNTTLGGGQIIIPDEQDPLRQQPPAQNPPMRDEEAHKRLDGHDKEIGALRADLDTFKAEYDSAQRFAVQGDMVRSNQARARAFHARSRLRAKGVSKKVFSEPALFKALEAALKSGKLDNLLKSRLNTWMADPDTTLGRMFTAYQDHEKILKGDPNNPNDDVAYRLENLEKWATMSQTQAFEPGHDYRAPAQQSTLTNPPAAGTTPPAPADKGTEPQAGPEKQGPPAPDGKAKSSSLLDKAKTPEGLGTMAFIGALGCLALPGVRRRITNAR